MPSGRALASGLAGIVLIGLAGCATAPASREADPAFARQNVAYRNLQRRRQRRSGSLCRRRTSRLVRSSSIRLAISSIWCRAAVWSGRATIHTKQEWPDWYPTVEMLQRKPELREHIVQLRSGIGMKGGPENPIGARALYLWSGNKDTLYRIHGTNEPWTIGTNVSSGCIRLTNDDVIDLYKRTPAGTKVIVLANAASTDALVSNPALRIR